MNIGSLTVSLGADLSGLDQMTKGLNTMAQRMRTFGYLSSIVLTAPMVMAGKAAFNMAKDFEFSIQKIVGLAGVAQESVNKWRESILKMAPEVAQTPQALADALYFIASSGIKGAEALDVLRVSATAAKAGLGETKVIADYLTSALNAYRGTGLTAAYATDVLVAAVREGKAEATGFATALGSIIPLAAHLGVSIDQVAGAMAAVTLTGSSAAQAATYLRSLFTVLAKKDQNSSGPGADALKSMNTSYSELRKILRSGPEGLINLMQKFRDMSASYGETLVGKVIPNVRGMMMIFSVAGKNFQYNSDMMKRVSQSSGSLAVALAAVSDTIKVQLDTAIAKAHVSLINFGQSIAPALLSILNYLVQKLEALTKWWSSLSQEQQNHKLKVLAVIAALGPLSLLFATLMYTMSGFVTVIKAVGTAWNFMTKSIIIGDLWGMIKAGFIGATVGAEGVTGAFAATAIAADAMSTTILASVVALGAFALVVGPILFVMSKIWDKIKEMKARMAEMKSAIDYSTPAMELDKKISSMMYKNVGTADKPRYVNDLKNKSEEELATLKTTIGQRITMEQEAMSKEAEIGRKQIEGEDFVLNKRIELAEWEGRLNEAKLKMRKGTTTPAEFNEWVRNITIEKQIVSDQINEYITNRQHEISVDKDLHQNTIDFYKDEQASVQKTMDNVAAYHAAVEKDMADEKDLLDKQSKAVDDLAEAWQKAGNLINDAFTLIKKGMNKDFWTMLTPAKSGDALTNVAGIGMMQHSRQTAGGFLMPQPLTLKPLEPFKSKEEITGSYTQTGKIMQDLGVELGFVDKKAEALGITMGKHRQLFDVARAKVSAYSSALEKLLDPSVERGPVWQAKVDETVDGLEKMQEQFNKMQSQRDFLNGISNSFVNLFTTILSGTKNAGQAIKEFALSILQSFEKMMAEKAMEKLMNGILNSTKLLNTEKAAGNAIDAAGVATDVAGTGVAMAMTSAKSGEAIASATASGAKEPFPYSLIAIAAGVAAVIAALASVKKFAKGGVVPEGFPNDTYLARLTSGETIIPKGINGMGNQTFSFEPVELRIVDNTLTGFLKKANKKQSLY